MFLTSQLRVAAGANAEDLNRTLSEVFERYERQVCGTDRPPASECVVDTYYEVSVCVWRWQGVYFCGSFWFEYMIVMRYLDAHNG